MRALITGGAGFIGSHLAEALLDKGHDVIVLDDLSTGRVENIEHLNERPGFGCVIDAVTNERVLARLMDGTDVVFHLAAAVGVRLVLDNPIHTIETNLNGTESVLRQASRHKTKVLVTSTSEVYGKGLALPFREDTDLVLGPPNKTRWGYATSKLMDEFLALAYWKQQQVPAIVVRLFNTVGPRQSNRYGMVLPTFVRAALTDQSMIVHGDGSQTRCFTGVDDAVDAMMALVGEPAAVGEVFNVGNGAEITIRDLAYKVKALCGSRSEIRYLPYSQMFDKGFEDMPRRVPDITKIQKLVGYRPKVHLNEIIEQTARYWAEEGANVTTAASRPVRIHPRLSREPDRRSAIAPVARNVPQVGPTASEVRARPMM
jgi:UDP-glucose 4-epimerase